jgi:hypothetical protein
MTTDAQALLDIGKCILNAQQLAWKIKITILHDDCDWEVELETWDRVNGVDKTNHSVGQGKDLHNLILRVLENK